jgi:hypothetical protein
MVIWKKVSEADKIIEYKQEETNQPLDEAAATWRNGAISDSGSTITYSEWF